MKDSRESLVYRSTGDTDMLYDAPTALQDPDAVTDVPGPNGLFDMLQRYDTRMTVVERQDYETEIRNFRAYM